MLSNPALTNIRLYLSARVSRNVHTTAFASWNYQITRMLVPGDWLHAVFAAIIGTALPYVAFLVGRDVSLCIIQMHSLKRTPVAGDSEITSANPQSDIDVDVDPEVDPDPDVESKSSATVGQNELPSNELTLRTHLIYFFFTLPLCISLLVATSAAAAVDRHHPIRRTKWASGAFAPLGATTRWLLSRFNRHGWFPRGTFIANMIGTLLDAVIGVVIILRDTGKSLDIVLPALISGLGGSLSTVSTWVNEASAMSRSHRYIYLATSLAVAQVLSILVYGTASWV